MSVSRLAAHLSPSTVPQSEPVPGKPMVPNNAGGFGFAVDDWTRLDRFLILGSDGGTYYVKERKLTQDNAACVLRCVATDGPRTVERIAAVSESGRAPKNGPAVFALALAAEHGTPPVKAAAYAALPRVCRIGTHLFEFAAAKKALGGAFGAGMRRAVGRWYTGKTLDQLAYQVVKYRNRSGFTHRDLLRLARPTGTPETDAVLRWCVRGEERGAVEKGPRDGPKRAYAATVGELPPLIRAFDELQRMAQAGASAKDVARFVADNALPREAIPTEHLTAPEVWEALLPTVPLTALVRNLATMTRLGVVAPLSAGTRLVCDRLADADRIRKARLHPFAVLLAARTYAAGHGDKSAHTWTPVPQVTDALDTAFYDAFGSVPVTGKRWLLALDVSGSMGSPILGSAVSCREATAAMALVTAKVEQEYHVMAFSDQFVPVAISKRMRMTGALKAVSNLPFSGTDCALPMIWAKKNKVPVDVFAVYTDSETWAGKVHPFQALQDYRQAMGIPAKVVVVGMTATEFTIADPSDAGMMDVVGFDAAAPAVMADFATGGATPAVETDEDTA